MNRHSTPSFKYKKRLNHTLILLFFLRSLIPLGFMPGNVLAGESWIKLCPQQQPQLFEALALSHHDHAHHQHHADGESNDVAPIACDWAGFVSQLDFIGRSDVQTVDTFSINSALRFFNIPQLLQTSTTSTAIRAPPAIV